MKGQVEIRGKEKEEKYEEEKNCKNGGENKKILNIKKVKLKKN